MKLFVQKAILVHILLFVSYSLSAGEIKIKIDKRYLNIPVSHKEDRHKMVFKSKGMPDLSVVVRLAPDEADYWVFKDVSDLKGKTLTISYDGNEKGLNKIYQDNTFKGEDNLYKEDNRPQFHFTTRRGWINDPNGLVYYDGEYHLFYQHNPFERDWENMHWGHAVSKDLVHWEEWTDALYPDQMGGMFSGSAVMDYGNTAGYNKGNTPAMIVAYTAAGPDKQVQCIAYSLDKGRTFTKYADNPVIDSKHIWNSHDTRDPKIFRYNPGNHWVMVLNERDGHSIYTSANLKNWKYESHVTGFWECPELFELAIDGNSNNKKWVMYGATGTYMLGSFDGKTFTPESGKYYYTRGSMYAGQTYTNMPDSDGRRIQIAWGRISHPGMPFNGMMSLPTELTLHTTKEGVRMFSNPVKETEQLFTPLKKWTSLTSDKANENLKDFYNAGTLRIKTTFKLSHATSAGIDLLGQRILDYDMNANTINGVFYTPEDRNSMKLTADIYIDKTSIEVFIDGGIYSYSMERRAANNSQDGIRFWGNNIDVENLEIFSVKSIWR